MWTTDRNDTHPIASRGSALSAQRGRRSRRLGSPDAEPHALRPAPRVRPRARGLCRPDEERIRVARDRSGERRASVQGDRLLLTTCPGSRGLGGRCRRRGRLLHAQARRPPAAAGRTAAGRRPLHGLLRLCGGRHDAPQGQRLQGQEQDEHEAFEHGRRVLRSMSILSGRPGKKTPGPKHGPFIGPGCSPWNNIDQNPAPRRSHRPGRVA